MFGYILPLKNYAIICAVLMLIDWFSGIETIELLASVSLWLTVIYFCIPVIRIEWCNRKIREILAKEIMDNEFINGVPLHKILVQNLPAMISDFKTPHISLYLNIKCPYCRGIHHQGFVKYVYGRNTSKNWTITSIDTLAISCLNKEKHSSEPWKEVVKFNLAEFKKDMVRREMKDNNQFN